MLEVITQAPHGTPRPIPLLFVHGAWHGAWCWEYFLPYFAQHGYHAHALSLRGHGASEGKAGLSWHSAAKSYVADVAQVVETLPTPPVLIGHSMGGYVVQKYLETRTVPAAVLLASMPVRGIFPFALRCMLRYPWATLKAHLLLDSQQLIATPEQARDLFFSPDLPHEELVRHHARLQGESFRLELEASLLALPRPHLVHTPLLVLGAANDRVFTVHEIEATARAYGTIAKIFPNMAHDMMLDRGWQNVANQIIDWLEGEHQRISHHKHHQAYLLSTFQRAAVAKQLLRADHSQQSGA